MLKDNIDQLKSRIGTKENKFIHLENQLEKQSINRTLDENRFTSSEPNHYSESHSKTDRDIEDKMIDLEDIINSIESTILAYEKLNTIHISRDNFINNVDPSRGTIPTAL